MTSTPPPRICATCGRRFEWRRKWAEVWDEVKYCSKGCRGGPGRSGRALETVIRRLLGSRPPTSTLCPSEAAREFFSEEEWKSRMEEVRRAGRRLAHARQIEVTQRGRRVDPSDARGAIRYRRGPAFTAP